MVDGEHVEDQVLALVPGLVEERADEAGADAVALPIGVDLDAGEVDLGAAVFDGDHADVCPVGGDDLPAVRVERTGVEGVYTESGGRAVHDFSGIDRVYDLLLETGLRPVVELSFMPRDLARDPGRTVFTWEAVISPPRSWERWADLVGGLADHLVQRYGTDEVVSRWAFEVWNEPNLEVFWSGTPIWWTEWGTTPTHFNQVGDSVFAAAFLLRGMASALGRVQALSHWVASDHFDELGAPPELFHGGFGLLSVGNLRKPRYWALDLLARLGRHRLPVTVSGDGAGGLVEALAARHDDGRAGSWSGT
ncbi:MAG TPA: hypothetical protein VIY52_29455 [Streptosporangiaceae bacterium]